MIGKGKAMTSRESIYNQLSSYLVELFEISEEDIRPDATLVEDLDLDSIDAVDLIVKFQDQLGKKIPATEFKSVRTLDDIVDRVYALAQE